MIKNLLEYVFKKISRKKFNVTIHCPNNTKIKKVLKML